MQSRAATTCNPLASLGGAEALNSTLFLSLITHHFFSVNLLLPLHEKRFVLDSHDIESRSLDFRLLKAYWRLFPGQSP